ncbi:MAG: type I DNA topoisomerase [Erysipelotrichaceae bacterium]
MKNVVIVESPAKSKTITKYLGNDFKVVSSKGHIRDLATSGSEGLGVDISNNFEANYVISKDKKKVVSELKKEVKDADMVYLASDPDREGEAIAYSLIEELGLKTTELNRVVFNEITKGAVTAAINNPRTVDMDLVRSQETRRIFDRMIGFRLSKLLRQKIRSKSAGRVQSVALKLICEREVEIEAFKPVEFWTIEADFDTKPKLETELTKISGKKAKVDNQEQANKILSEIDNFIIEDIKSANKKRNAKPPLITSTLQQTASTKLNFSAKKTMIVAQKLYEGITLKDETVGLITYMRTDSYRLSNDFISSATSYIEENYGKEYVGFYASKKNSNAQDAHEAIRPTSVYYTPESIKEHLSSDEYKLYKLIYARAVSAMMAPAVFTTQKIILKSAGKYEFSASGSIQTFDGYLKLAGEFESNKDVILPDLTKEKTLSANDVRSVQHFTEPPLRYSEARLIKELEEKGIGRPSTYATIIDKITARHYCELKKASETSKTKVFFPTDQGILTNDKLQEFFSSIINSNYTSNMESQLDEIAAGELNHIKVLHDFNDKLLPLLKKANTEMEKIAPKETGDICPQCGSAIVLRHGRFGEFKACSAYPTCKFILNDKPKAEPVYLDKKCPECGSELMERVARRTGKKFIGCSNFPKCKYLENIKVEAKTDTDEAES